MPNLISQAFSSFLPSLGQADSNRYTTVSPSGTTTKSAVPPVLLLCGPVKPLSDLAEQALQSKVIRDQVLPNSNLSHVQSPVLNLISEQDVVFASSIHILTEVFAILNLLWPGRWGCRSEATNSSLTQHQGASGAVENVRYDLIFYALNNKNGKAAGTIAILEYKKTDMIAYADFCGAMKDRFDLPDVLNGFVKECKTTTKLDRNGKTYMKQLSTYAKAQNCSHVALFNWQHFIALVFDLSHKDRRFTAGAQAGLIWVSEIGTGTFVNNSPIRHSMLGWLLRAFREKFEG